MFEPYKPNEPMEGPSNQVGHTRVAELYSNGSQFEGLTGLINSICGRLQRTCYSPKDRLEAIAQNSPQDYDEFSRVTGTNVKVGVHSVSDGYVVVKRNGENGPVVADIAFFDTNVGTIESYLYGADGRMFNSALGTSQGEILGPRGALQYFPYTRAAQVRADSILRELSSSTLVNYKQFLNRE